MFRFEVDEENDFGWETTGSKEYYNCTKGSLNGLKTISSLYTKMQITKSAEVKAAEEIKT